MKGLILAGGSGTRLHPLTLVVSKQLLPVYDKPMIYYPLSTLMLAGIRDVLIISTPHDVPRYRALLGDGGQLGIAISYAVQARPDGLAHAFVVGADFVGTSPAALILGDNVFHGERLAGFLQPIAEDPRGATVFAHAVRDPERYGVVELDASGSVLSIEEKPVRPRSQYAIPGLYFYDGAAVDMVAQLEPSVRGELEITDLNNAYRAAGRLNVRIMGHDVTWLDAGTHESLLEAANFIEATQSRRDLLVGSIEEVAFRMGFVDAAQLGRLAASFPQNEYARYLLRVADGTRPT